MKYGKGDKAEEVLKKWREEGYRYIASECNERQKYVCCPCRFNDIPEASRISIDRDFGPIPGLVRYFTIPEKGDLKESRAFIEIDAAIRELPLFTL